jgi:hypothetical protein
MASPKFVEKVQTMATAEVELKSPFVPLFKGGIFSVRFSPLFAKEGKGEIFEQNDAGII